MKLFRCPRLRLCNYLMERGFFPVQTEPDPQNPRYKIYLFEETPALTSAVVRYFATDCYTAKKRNGRMINYENSKNDGAEHPHQEK